MSSTSLGRSRRSELEVATVVVVVVVGVAAGAWALTADRMAGMNASPGAELGGLGWFAISWLLTNTDPKSTVPRICGGTRT